jgi:hypothetical protein
LESRSALQRPQNALHRCDELVDVAIVDAAPIELIDKLREHSRPGLMGRNCRALDWLDDYNPQRFLHLDQLHDYVDRREAGPGSTTLPRRAADRPANITWAGVRAQPAGTVVRTSRKRGLGQTADSVCSTRSPRHLIGKLRVHSWTATDAPHFVTTLRTLAGPVIACTRFVVLLMTFLVRCPEAWGFGRKVVERGCPQVDVRSAYGG